MKLKTTLRLSFLGLAGYGGYTLWKRYGLQLRERFEDRDAAAASVRRVQERAHLTVEESVAGSDDPVAQATAILADSDARTRLPRTADGIEHRRSEDTVDP
jgi:hypothetical protein